MKQEQLSLETCQEIGHLFPYSRYGWIVYEEPKDPSFPRQEPELYDYWEPRKPWCEFYTRLASHPSITDMLRWLWGRSYRLNIWTSPEIYELQFYSPMNCRWGRTEFIQAASPIEAYAEAVKIVLKEMEK